MMPNMLGLDKYYQSYKHLKILQSGPIEIEKMANYLIFIDIWEHIWEKGPIGN